jgi:hypothetical protein
MSQSVALLLGVHAHQPVGNFDFVMDDAHQRCYQPFLRLMHRFPDFHFSIHISGWLFDYLLKKYPDDITLLREMVQRGQAELFGAGYTEPVLAALPMRDRIGQIERMAACMEQALGQRPQGAWLTERVWESNVVPPLADCGVKYATVDDYHFLCTGKQSSELDGYFTTEEDGRQLDLLPISETLRYRIPFSPAHEVVSLIEGMAGERDNAAIYFDDIEKFGIWPETYEWVYERGWLEQFIQGVLASPLIHPMRFGDYHRQANTRGVVYLPTASYIEMNEWTLPSEPAHRYADLVQSIKQQGHYDDDKPFVRGGIWRNFMTRYPESNWMHKRMLQLSNRYHALPEAQQSEAMREALYESQANDAYWHGLFGGLYLPHLRRAVYHAIVRLEHMLDQVAARPACATLDLELSGQQQTMLQNGVLQAIIMGDGSASLCELDTYALNHNFADTLMRQSEHYHRKVVLSQASQHSGQGIANPHERVSFKHEILPEDMILDTRRRTLFIDRIIAPNGERQALAWHNAAAGADASAHYMAPDHPGIIAKSISLAANQLRVEYQFDTNFSGQFETELNLAMPSCDGAGGQFKTNDHIWGGFGQVHHLTQCSEVTLHDDVLGGQLKLSASQPVTVYSAPCFSVSQSEAGFEKIMQAVTLIVSCTPPAGTFTLTVEIA